MTRLKKRSDIVDKWVAIFSGKRCKLSDRFMRTIAQFGLHNMNGSDEAAEMGIASVFEGLAEEVGLPLSSSALSFGCPSRRTLARAEKRLAVDVYLSAVRDIQKDFGDDEPIYISLMVDHGKRSGIEHFVKLIV